MTISGPSPARARSGAPANKRLNKRIAISGPSPARARSGAPVNKRLNKKMTSSGPSPARARSGAPANKRLSKKNCGKNKHLQLECQSVCWGIFLRSGFLVDFSSPLKKKSGSKNGNPNVSPNPRTKVGVTWVSAGCGFLHTTCNLKINKANF